MGRGNYIPPVSRYSNADYETIYIDNELVYGEKHWENCREDDYYFYYQDFKEDLISEFTRRFPTFSKNDEEWLDSTTKIVAENSLCMLTVCDDDNYIAVSVISKEDDYNAGLVNLANRHLPNYAKFLKEFALDTYGQYRVRTSAWTSAIIKKEVA